MENAKKPRDQEQQIRLLLNLIAPNNFSKKLNELRAMLIGDAKLLNEPGYDPKDSEGFAIAESKLEAVVQTVFRKA